METAATLRAKSDDALKAFARAQLLVELKTAKIENLRKRQQKYLAKYNSASLKGKDTSALLDKLEYYADEISYQQEKLEVIEEEFTRVSFALQAAHIAESRFLNNRQ